MPSNIIEQIDHESRVESPQVYNSKFSINELSAEDANQEKVGDPTAKDNIAEQRIIHLYVKSNLLQVGNNNDIIIVTKEPEMKYQKLPLDSEPSNIVQERPKINVATENTESEDEMNENRINDNFRPHSQCVIELESKVEASSGVRQPRSKQRKKRSRRGTKSQLAIVPKCMQPPEASESYIAFCRISDEVMMEVQPYRDNGQWKMFRDAVTRMSRKHTSPEAKIIILLEESQAACYQSNLEESERMIWDAIRAAANTENYSSLIARANFYLSGVKRRTDCIGTANTRVDLAKQNLHGKEVTLDTTFADYERGSVLMDFLKKVPKSSKAELLKTEAKACLKKCIEGSVRLERGDGQIQRYIKKHHFAYIKIALLNLDCRSVAGRQKEVSAADIQEAKDCLDTLRRDYWDGIAQGEKIQYHLAMSDLNWRLQDFDKAESFAQDAYRMATKCGFNTEIKPAKERLEEIQGMQGKSTQLLQNKLECAAQLSDSCHGDVSSSCESDCSLSPSQ